MRVIRIVLLIVLLLALPLSGIFSLGFNFPLIMATASSWRPFSLINVIWSLIYLFVWLLFLLFGKKTNSKVLLRLYRVFWLFGAVFLASTALVLAFEFLWDVFLAYLFLAPILGIVYLWGMHVHEVFWFISSALFYLVMFLLSFYVNRKCSEDMIKSY